MTVPLKFQDEVIGTLNVESPRVNGFGADDLQFTELFSQEIAAALHTLDLLSAQQVCTASQSIEAVNKEIALPLDEVLAGASVLLEKLPGADGEVVARLRRMLDAARQIKDNVSTVGRIPVEQIVFPGGDASLVTNLEYRITIAGPVALAPFVDVGTNPVVRGSQLRINPGQLADINSTVFGCPALDIALNCIGGHHQSPPFSQQLQVVDSTNWIPRMSTGLEVQVFLPIINAPFRVYWAYNPLRLDNITRGAVPITRDMFPPGAAGDFTFQQASRSLTPAYQLREPRKTFRFSVATTF